MKSYTTEQIAMEVNLIEKGVAKPNKTFYLKRWVDEKEYKKLSQSYLDMCKILNKQQKQESKQ